MARERSTVSNVAKPVLTGLNGGKPAADVPRPTRAQAQALRRSEPQTHARLQDHFAQLRPPGAPPANDPRDRADCLSGDCIHTVYRPATGNWANEAGSGQRVYGVHATKEESVRLGQVLARAAQTHHVIHNRDGTIGSLDAYGGDEAVSRPR